MELLSFSRTTLRSNYLFRRLSRRARISLCQLYVRNYWQLRIRLPLPLFSSVPLSVSLSMSHSLSLSLSFSYFSNRTSWTLTSTFSTVCVTFPSSDAFRHSTLKVISTIMIFQAARWELQLTGVFSRLLYWSARSIHASAYTRAYVRARFRYRRVFTHLCEDKLPRQEDKLAASRCPYVRWLVNV